MTESNPSLKKSRVSTAHVDSILLAMREGKKRGPGNEVALMEENAILDSPLGIEPRLFRPRFNRSMWLLIT